MTLKKHGTPRIFQGRADDERDACKTAVIRR